MKRLGSIKNEKDRFYKTVVGASLSQRLTAITVVPTHTYFIILHTKVSYGHVVACEKHFAHNTHTHTWCFFVAFPSHRSVACWPTSKFNIPWKLHRPDGCGYLCYTRHAISLYPPLNKLEFNNYINLTCSFLVPIVLRRCAITNLFSSCPFSVYAKFSIGNKVERPLRALFVLEVSGLP